MTDTRTDLRELLFSTVTGDAVFRTQTGWSTLDPRLYWYYQGDTEVIDDYRPAFVTFSVTAEGEAPYASENMVFSVMIWAREPDLPRVLAIRDRLTALFHKKVLTTNLGRKVYAKKINEQDYFMADLHFAGVNMQFRLGWSTV